MNLKKLFVNGCIPKSGEYSLIINKVDKRAKKKKDPVACYLVATEVDTASGMLDYFEKPETLDEQKIDKFKHLNNSYCLYKAK